jgi:arginine/lysine/histidine transport system permease protein
VSDLDFNALRPFAGQLLSALGTTIEISVLALLLSLPLGLIGALLRTARARPARVVVGAYVEVLRNVPLLVTIYFFFYGLPGAGVHIGAFVSGLIAMTLNSSAYVTEIFRGGLAGIDKGQREAAHALGLRRTDTVRFVILPQLMRISYPALGNQVVGLILGSALVSVVGISELTHVSYVIGSQTFRYFEVFVVAGLLYLVAVQIVGRAWGLAGRRLRLHEVRR